MQSLNSGWSAKPRYCDPHGEHGIAAKVLFKRRCSAQMRPLDEEVSLRGLDSRVDAYFAEFPALRSAVRAADKRLAIE